MPVVSFRNLLSGTVSCHMTHMSSDRYSSACLLLRDQNLSSDSLHISRLFDRLHQSGVRHLNSFLDLGRLTLVPYHWLLEFLEEAPKKGTVNSSSPPLASALIPIPAQTAFYCSPSCNPSFLSRARSYVKIHNVTFLQN
jgi:hypothetical protein